MYCYCLPKGPLRRSDTNPTTLCDVSHSTQARDTCNCLSFSLRTFVIPDLLIVCRAAASLKQPCPDLCPLMGLPVLLTGVNWLQIIPPASYGGVYDIYPFLHRPSPSGYWGQGRGEGCQPPYSVWSSILTYYRQSSFKGYLRVPGLRSTSLRGNLSVFFYSLVILYQNVLQMSRQ